MPLYLCRWPNGDCSVVWASTKGAAVELLDEIANAEGCPLTPIQDFMVNFRLTDEGRLQLEGFGEATEDAIFHTAYPILNEAMLNAPAHEETGDLTAGGIALVQEAVAQERKRVRPKKVKEPQTELGRKIKRETDMPTGLVDRQIRRQADETLRRFRGGGKLN